MAEGIGRLRSGQVERIPGFDGEYGVIRLFSAEELNNTEGQMNFFDLLGASQPGGPAAGGEHGAGKKDGILGPDLGVRKRAALPGKRKLPQRRRS